MAVKFEDKKHGILAQVKQTCTRGDKKRRKLGPGSIRSADPSKREPFSTPSTLSMLPCGGVPGVDHTFGAFVRKCRREERRQPTVALAADGRESNEYGDPNFVLASAGRALTSFVLECF